MYESASVAAIVTSHERGFLVCHGSKVRPSGHLPLLQETSGFLHGWHSGRGKCPGNDIIKCMVPHDSDRCVLHLNCSTLS